MKRQAFALLTRNTPGVLRRICGLFSRRGYSIESITCGITADPSIARMTIITEGSDVVLSQIKNQLSKQIDVINIWTLPEEKSVYRELALIKLSTTAQERQWLIETTNIFRGNIVDVSGKTITVEITGNSDKIDAFIELVKNYTVLEIVRSGITGLTRGTKE